MKLNAHMERGIRSILTAVTAFYLTNRKGRRFLAQFAPEARQASRRRRDWEAKGLQVPPFLIASIASQCNLHCVGCYARAEGMCGDGAAAADLLPEDWDRVFQEAKELGVSFILLAGGEPLLKRDVLEVAARRKEIAFPVFTNGLLLTGSYLTLFDEHRNLIPVISIEGSGAQTDLRRGSGVARQLESVMAELRQRGMLFAVSITVTRENLHQVTQEAFLQSLDQVGCGIVFYVEYVPIRPETQSLALTEADSRWLNEQVSALKQRRRDRTILSFPGDEAKLGGCLAAGRGFFHINPAGGAEPCPFSPHSQLNVREASLETVLRSAFFRQVREIGAAETAHLGGCTLFLHEQEVSALSGAVTK